MSKVLTPEDVAERPPPNGYTTEEWAGMTRAAASLEVGWRPKELKIKVAIPDTATRWGPTAARRTATLTYVIRCGDFVKIGATSDIHLRLRTLEAYNPLALDVVAVLKGGFSLEREMHAYFAKYRHRDEWFREEGELAAWIKAGCPL